MFVLSKSDCQDLVLNLLESIHNIVNAKKVNNGHQKSGISVVYCALDILILLSQDVVFSTNLFKLDIEIPSWYSSNTRSVSIGSFILIMLFQTLKQNTNHHKDLYLHAAIIAILNNIGYSVVELPVLCCQKAVNFLEFLAKKQGLLGQTGQKSEVSNHGGEKQLLSSTLSNVDDQVQNSTMSIRTDENELQSSAVLNADNENELQSSTVLNADNENELKQDQETFKIVLDDLVLVTLNLFHTILTNNKEHNLNLVYTLLDKQPFLSTFESNRTHSSLSTIDKVLFLVNKTVNHVITEIEKANLQTPRVDVIMEIIKTSIKALSLEKQSSTMVMYSLEQDPNATEYFQSILAEF